MEVALWWGAIAVEAGLIALVLYRRIYRLLPIFFIWLIWTVISDLAMWMVRTRIPAEYLHIYLVEMPIDSVMQFVVLVELAWSVLRPIRSSLPRGALWVVIGILLFLGALVWPIAGISALGNVPNPYRIMFRLLQTFSMLRVLLFLVMAAFSQVLAIGWRDRELQVATGFGFYSIVSVAGAMLHAQMPGQDRYHHIDEIVAVSYFCSLLYWTFSFAQREAARQEFTPRMQSFLLAVSGTARANRLTLEEMRKSGK